MLSAMRLSIIRWSLLAVAAALLGPLAWTATGSLRAPDGYLGTTALVSTQPFLGLLRLLGAGVLALGIGLAGARLVSRRAGFAYASVVLAWAAFGAGTAESVLRSAQIVAAPAMGVAVRLSLEAAIVGAATVAIAWLIGRAAKGGPPQLNPALAVDRDGIALGPESAREPASLALAVGVGGVAAALAAWLVAQNGLKGQSLGAGVVAGVLSAALLTMLRPGLHWWAALVGPVLTGVAAPLAASVLHGGDAVRGLYAASEAGSLLRAATLAPLDWAAGGLLGVPWGVGLGQWLAGATRPQGAGDSAGSESGRGGGGAGGGVAATASSGG